MKKLLLILVMLILVVSLSACDEPDGLKDDDTAKINSELVEDIAGEIKDVFEVE